MIRKRKPIGKRRLTPQEGGSERRLMPAWYRAPKDQIKYAQEIWPGIKIPMPPEKFTPRTKGEVLLLHVPKHIGELWYLIGDTDSPRSYEIGTENVVSEWYNYIKLSEKAIDYQAKPAWVAFDPDNGLGKSLKDFYNEENMAGSEVLSAILQFPNLPLMWENDRKMGVCAVGCRSGENGSTLGFYLSVMREPRRLEPLHVSKDSGMRFIVFPTVRRV